MPATAHLDGDTVTHCGLVVSRLFTVQLRSSPRAYLESRKGFCVPGRPQLSLSKGTERVASEALRDRPSTHLKPEMGRVRPPHSN